MSARPCSRQDQAVNFSGSGLLERTGTVIERISRGGHVIDEDNGSFPYSGRLNHLEGSLYVFPSFIALEPCLRFCISYPPKGEKVQFGCEPGRHVPSQEKALIESPLSESLGMERHGHDQEIRHGFEPRL